MSPEEILVISAAYISIAGNDGTRAVALGAGTVKCSEAYYGTLYNVAASRISSVAHHVAGQNVP